QQLVESFFGLCKTAVMTNSGRPWYIESRLRRVQLPWMDVKRCRGIAPLSSDDCSARQSERKHSEVAATRSRQVHTEPPKSGRRDLDQRPGRTVDPVRIPTTLRIAIPAACHRKQAGVVCVALFHQDIQRPFQPRHDREARCAEASDGHPANLLQYRLAAVHRLTELDRTNRRHARVVPPVGGKLVALLDNSTDDVRAPLGQPAEDEEGATRIVAIQ